MYSFIYRLHVSIAFSGILRKMKFREMLLSDSATNMSKPATSIGKRQEKKGDIELKFFELHDLKAATNNFSPDNKLGEGGFGPVFKVLLLQPEYLIHKYALTPKENGKKSLQKLPDSIYPDFS